MLTEMLSPRVFPAASAMQPVSDRIRMPRVSIDNIRELLDNGGFSDIVDAPRETRLLRALELAAENAHAPLVAELIVEGADVTTSADPLIAACDAGNLAIVRLLLDAGADVNGRGRLCGETPLMSAASSGFVDIVRLLIERGADMALFDTDPDPKNALGWVAMGSADCNWPDGMPADVRRAYGDIVAILKAHEEPAA